MTSTIEIHIAKKTKDYYKKVNWGLINMQKEKIYKNLSYFNRTGDTEALLEIAKIYRSANHYAMAEFFEERAERYE